MLFTLAPNVSLLLPSSSQRLWIAKAAAATSRAARMRSTMARAEWGDWGIVSPSSSAGGMSWSLTEATVPSNLVGEAGSLRAATGSGRGVSRK